MQLPLTNLMISITLILSSLNVSNASAHAIETPNPSTQSTPVHNQNNYNQDSSKQSSDRKSPTLGQLRSKYSETFKFSGPHVKRVALTFDDVPDARYTSQVLDVLKMYKVKATFFVVGDRARKHPEIVRRIQREGHIIGNHSYNHPNFKPISLVKFQKQITRTEQVIQSIVGYRPKFIRPPYGEINEEQLKWAQRQGYTVVNWNVDSLDWKGLNKVEIQNNILQEVGPGSIILMHAGGGVGSNLTGTIKALPDVVKKLRGEGYQFVDLSHLLGISNKNKKTVPR